MPRKAIQKHTEVVNQLLNHPDVLHPTIRQYYWFNEQDSLDELWLICSSFIADINAALMSPNSPPVDSRSWRRKLITGAFSMMGSLNAQYRLIKMPSATIG
ncbi:hypothetical protein AB4428_16755 [Vibrio lentus]